jgi:hypothetical protein
VPMPFNVGNEASSTQPRGLPVRPTAGCAILWGAPKVLRQRRRAPDDASGGLPVRIPWARCSRRSRVRLLAHRSAEPHFAGALHFDIT